jgi:hypothetical protein
MKRESVRNAVLGLQLGGAGLDRAREWSNPVFSRLEQVPVLWNLPALPRSAGGIIDELRRRLQSGRDLIVPMGYSGAIHPVLALEEIQKELAWGSSNPWSTGVKDLFGVETRVLAPRIPDFRRPQAAKAYLEAGFSRICLRWPDRNGPCRKGGLTLIPFIPLLPVRGTSTEVSRSLGRAIGKRSGPLVMVDLSRFESADLLAGYIDALLAFFPAAGYTLAPPETLLGGKAQDLAESLPEAWADIPAQPLRRNIAAISYLQRKKKKKNEDFRKILEHLSYCGAWDVGSTDKGMHEDKTREKTLVAHMQGDVMLAGSEFDVRMSGGRFFGLVRHGAFITPNVPASSYLTIMGKTYHFKSRSAISFEGDAGTGLRDDLLLDAALDGGRLSIEYEFRGDAPELFISVSMKYPRFQTQTVDAIAPLILSLAEIGPEGSAEIAAVYPDGSTAQYALGESDGWKAVPGMSWQVRTSMGGIALHASPVSEKKWGLCFFRVVKTRGRRYVEVNPFGSPDPIPAALIGGRTEAHSLLIGLPKTRSKGGA